MVNIVKRDVTKLSFGSDRLQREISFFFMESIKRMWIVEKHFRELHQMILKSCNTETNIILCSPQFSAFYVELSCRLRRRRRRRSWVVGYTTETYRPKPTRGFNECVISGVGGDGDVSGGVSHVVIYIQCGGGATVVVRHIDPSRAKGLQTCVVTCKQLHLKGPLEQGKKYSATWGRSLCFACWLGKLSFESCFKIFSHIFKKYSQSSRL